MSEEVSISWRSVPILLGVAVSLIASSLTVAKTEQYRLTYVTHVMLWSPFLDMVCMIITTAGSVWCCNTIMSAGISFDDHANTSYDIGMMLISAGVGIVLTLLGYIVTAYDRIFTKTKLEILDMFISDSVTHNIESVRNTSTVMRLGLLKGIIHIAIGGVLTGIAIFGSHLILIASLRVDNISLRYYAGPLVGTALVSIAGATLSCWMLFRLLSFYPHKEILRVIVTLCLCTTHIATYFLILASVTFRTSESVASQSHRIDLSDLRDRVLCAAMIWLWLMAYTYHIDMRHRTYVTDRVLRKTDDIMSQLQHDPRLNSDPQILRYHHLRRKVTRRSSCCGILGLSEASRVPSILLSRSRSSTKVFVENIQQSAEEQLSARLDEDAVVITEKYV